MPTRRRPKVLVIGLDGLEPTIVEAMLAAGELPNLARLAGAHGPARVATTSPAQTPVAWSTFATGTNPGGHGIFDFLRRDPAKYLPDNGLNRYEQKNPFLPPKAVNWRRGKPVWEHLAAAGIPSTVLRCPCTYPPDRLRGSMLSGMGVPDLRGGFGTGTFYSPAAGLVAGEGEHLVPLPADAPGPIRTHLIGPRHPRTREDIRLDIELVPDLPGDRLLVRSDGTPRELAVRAGTWSDWLRVRFRLGPLQHVRGLVRFYLVRLRPMPELYASPIQFDPDSPLFPISAPPEYGSDLAAEIGPYYTAGLVEDHNGLQNGRLDEGAFLDQCEIAWRERRAMLARELDRFDSGLLYCLFDTPDRVQHMFWRHREPDHPAHQGRPPDPAFARAIEDHYRRGDEVVGEVLAHVDDDTLLIVLSDHGFNGFRRGFDVNRWLYDQGLLALRDGLRPGHEAGDLLRGIDWDRTRAYALGLSGLYLNLRGREARGTVAPEEAEALRAQIAGALTGLTDPEHGRLAIRSARRREDVYAGPYVAEAPDILIHYAHGYRVGWSTSIGGVAEGGPFEDNTRKWSGDHIIDPELVPGVLLMNRPFAGSGARLEDLAPTILAALGAPAEASYEGRSLLS